MLWCPQRSSISCVSGIRVRTEIEENTVSSERWKLCSVQAHRHETEGSAVASLPFQGLVLSTDPLRLGRCRRPDQNACLTLLQSVFQHSDQPITAGENNLVEENFESLLMEHVVEVEYPVPVDGAVRE